MAGERNSHTSCRSCGCRTPRSTGKLPRLVAAILCRSLGYGVGQFTTGKNPGFLWTHSRRPSSIGLVTCSVVELSAKVMFFVKPAMMQGIAKELSARRALLRDQ